MKTTQVNIMGLAALAALIGSLLFPSTGTLAQNTGGGASSLEEVIVTARKRAESLQDLALSVSALGEQEISASFATDTRDLISMSPNTVLDDTNQGPGGVAAAYIRGIGVSEVEKNFDPAVGAVVDGVFLGTMSGSLTRAIDLERVEVLRGPQGTLFGRNTIGGVIKVDRSRPTMALGGKARASYGNYETAALDGVVNFGDGANYGVKLTASYRDQGEGFYDSVVTDEDIGSNEYLSLGANVLWAPRDDLELEWTWVIEETEQDTNVLLNVGQPGQSFCDNFGYCSPSTITPTSGDRYKTQQAFENVKLAGSDDVLMQSGVPFNHNGLSPEDTSFDADTIQFEARWDINDSLRFEYIYALWETEEEIISDWDAVEALLFHTDRPAEYEQTTQELRLTYDAGGALRGTVGAYVWDSEYEIRLISWIGFATDPLSLLSLPQTTNQESESWALFFEGDYDLSQRWTLTAGLRYTEDDKTSEQRGVVPCGQSQANLRAAGHADIADLCADTANFLTTPITGSESWDELTPKLALKHELNDDSMIYGLYSRGYRAGGFNGRVDAVSAATVPYDPEIVDNFELGYRSEWLGRTVTFNATLFHMEYDDKQEEIQLPSTTSGTGQVTLVVNAAEATIQGAEFELAWLAAEGVTLRGNLGLLDAEYDSFTVNTMDGPRDFSHLDFRRAPEVTFGLSGDFRFDLGAGSGRFWTGIRYLGDHEVDFANKPELSNDSQTLVDMSFTYEYRDWYASVFGRNLTEEDGYQIGFDVAGLWSYAAPRAPRTWGVEVGLKFGD